MAATVRLRRKILQKSTFLMAVAAVREALHLKLILVRTAFVAAARRIRNYGTKHAPRLLMTRPQDRPFWS